MPVAVTNPALSALAGLLVTNIQINGEAVNLTNSEVSQVQITNREGEHETATITTQLTKAQITRFVNQPITFRYGHKLDENEWFGYVIVITPNRDYQADTIVDLLCFGTTWPMQNGTPRYIRNITAPDMFAAMVTGSFRQDISTGYNLGAQVDAHSYSWPVLAQTDESDWQFLLTLGMRIGYAVYAYRGVVRLVRPRRVLTETPIFASYIKGDEILDQTRTLLDWEASTQSLDLRQNLQPSFGFFDGTAPITTRYQYTNGVQSAFPQGSASSVSLGSSASTPSTTNISSPYRMASDTPIRDRGMAETYAAAWENRVDFWNSQAMARINGNAQVIPGVNIAVQVSGVPNGHNEHDGIWLVRGVTHVLTHNSFQTQLDLARDTSLVPINAKTNWFWLVPRGRPRVMLDPTTNRWKSSWGASPEFINTTLVA